MITTEHRKAAARIALRLARARGDFETFVRVAVRDNLNRPLDLAEYQLQWMAHLDYCWSRGLGCILIAPFGSGKTSGFAVPLLTWLLGRDNNARAKIVTNEDDSAKFRVGLARRIMEGTAYRAIFPGVRQGKKWTDHAFFLERTGMAADPSLHARGLFSKGLGGRADFILFDDIVDQQNSSNSDQRKRVNDMIQETWLSRVSPAARFLYVATPWHLDDVTHHLIEMKGWCTLIQRVSPTDAYWHSSEVVGAGEDYPWLDYRLVGQGRTA